MMNKTHAKHSADAAAERARNVFVSAKNKAVEMRGAFEDSVKENPLRSVLIAAGVGMLLGLIYSKK